MMPTDLQTPYRYAVYFAPQANSAWWRAGSSWLGRCAASRSALSQPAVPGLSTEVLARITAAPRRYGWHATLKAPFKLGVGQSVTHLLDALEGICLTTPRFTLPALSVSTAGGFVALRPVADAPHLKALAARCVTELQPLAEPLSESELAHRRRAPLTPEQDHLLQRWGYPWVLDQFQFHFSLTEKLDDWAAPQAGVVAHAVIEAARQHFQDLPLCTADCVSVFAEPEKGGDFVLLEQLELRG